MVHLLPPRNLERHERPLAARPHPHITTTRIAPRCGTFEHLVGVIEESE